MRYEEYKIAEKFNIIDKVQKLEKELLTIKDVTDVCFDLRGFYDNMHDVIFLVKYDISVNLHNYYEVRKQLIKEAIKVATSNGLIKTNDRIEDYGEYFYFVFTCDNTW